MNTMSAKFLPELSLHVCLNTGQNPKENRKRKYFRYLFLPEHSGEEESSQAETTDTAWQRHTRKRKKKNIRVLIQTPTLTVLEVT